MMWCGIMDSLHVSTALQPKAAFRYARLVIDAATDLSEQVLTGVPVS